MNKKFGIVDVQFILFIVIILMGVLILGSEPTNWSESGLYNYEHYYDKGNNGWYILRVFYSLIGLSVGIFIYQVIRKSLR